MGYTLKKLTSKERSKISWYVEKPHNYGILYRTKDGIWVQNMEKRDKKFVPYIS
jgi:hypothetical protein